MAIGKLCLTLPYTREVEIKNPVSNEYTTMFQGGEIFIYLLYHLKGMNYYSVGFHENGSCFYSYYSCYDTDKCPLNFIISEMLHTCSELNISIVPCSVSD